MKNRLFFVLLTILVMHGIQAQVRLNVEGEARIIGRIEVQKSTTDSSLYIGPGAGVNDLDKNQSTFIGNHAGHYNTRGFRNVFVGHEAGRFNTEGWGNVYVGTNAGEYSTDGFSNVFLGEETGTVNTTGSVNTFLGRAAGRTNRDGSSNLFAGTFAGYSNESGGYNTYLGTFAGERFFNGYRNTLIGYQAGGTADLYALDRAIAIGHRAVVNCSNCAVIGGTGVDAVNVGIGTTRPSGALHILKEGAPPAGLDADQNGLMLGVEKIPGYKWIQSYGGNLILNLMGNAVGVATSAVDYTLEVNGTAGKPGGGDWTNSASDRRLKKNIRPYTDGLEKLLKIRPVWYQYNGKAELPPEPEYVGIIAQEMQEIAPYTVGSFRYENTEYLNFDGSALRYMLINAVKDLHGELEQKDQHISSLEQRLNEVEAKLEQLLAQQAPSEDPDGNSYTLGLKERAMLYPNRPNPFSDKTIFRYRLPDMFGEARLQITAADGKVLGSLALQNAGEGEIAIETGTYPAGTYYYSLIVDGQIVDTRSMIKK
jgi:hypothetical protein